MSLLDKASEDVLVFLEESVTDRDGNVRTRPSATGIPAKARLQVHGQSGTSARRAEVQDIGYQTEQVYTIRFPRSFPHTLGAQSQIEWRGKRWSVFGDVSFYNGSRRTAHVEYTIRRS
jgi:hypothetical protein